MALQMNVSGIRRNLKNIAHNYTDAQVKVREATSNDPWGPSSTLMSEVADLTYNVVAFSEIMQMIWKRLNDHGRYWRHVYKALVLLEYLIKTGTEKVADQCKENIFAIQTLKDFQYLEENKDMGINVREKAKMLVSLLKDDERLRNERVRALKAKERFSQSVAGIGSEAVTYATSMQSETADLYQGAEHQPSASELESARPQTIGEEELQLQLALAMSKEEADQEEAKRKSDDVRLQLAISQSETDYKDPEVEKSSLSDLLDINFNPNRGGSLEGVSRTSDSVISPTVPNSCVDPWGMPLDSNSSPTLQIVSSIFPQYPTPDQQEPKDPWSPPVSGPSSRVNSPPISNDPWAPASSKSPELTSIADSSSDPWTPAPSIQKSHSNDPWAPVASKSPVDPFLPLPSSSANIGESDEFSAISTRKKATNDSSDTLNQYGKNIFGSSEDMSHLSRPKSKSPANFLGENANLVNLDNLVSTKGVLPPGIDSPQTNYQSLNSLGTPSSTIFSTASEGLHGLNSHPPSNENTHSVLLGMSPGGKPTNPFFSASSTAAVDHHSSFVAGVNPFDGATPPPNPFQAQQAPKPSMNQMRTTTIGTAGANASGGLSSAYANEGSNSPWVPSNNDLNVQNSHGLNAFSL